MVHSSPDETKEQLSVSFFDKKYGKFQLYKSILCLNEISSNMNKLKYRKLNMLNCEGLSPIQ